MAELMKPAEAAKLIGVNISTLKMWARNGQLKAQYTLGGQARYIASEIRKLAKAR